MGSQERLQRVPSEELVGGGGAGSGREAEREGERGRASMREQVLETNERRMGMRKTLKHQGAKWLWLDVSCILFSMIFPEKAGSENRRVANNVACPCQDLNTEETF